MMRGIGLTVEYGSQILGIDEHRASSAYNNIDHTIVRASACQELPRMIGRIFLVRLSSDLAGFRRAICRTGTRTYTLAL